VIAQMGLGTERVSENQEGMPKAQPTPQMFVLQLPRRTVSSQAPADAFHLRHRIWSA